MKEMNKNILPVLFLLVSLAGLLTLSGCNIVWKSHNETTSMNTEKAAKENVNMSNSLKEACQKADYETVKTLLKNGTKANSQDEDGNTTLMYAIQAPFAHYDVDVTKKIIKILVSAGANVNASDNDGNTVLMRVVSEFSYSDGADDDREELIDVLVSAGAKVDAKNKDGKTALMSIGLDGWINYSRIVTKLLSVGANINATDNQGRTVLMDFVNKIDEKESSLPDNDDYERECPTIEQVKSFLNTLISSGADLNAKDKDDKTALTIAEERENKEIIKILKAAGAKE